MQAHRYECQTLYPHELSLLPNQVRCSFLVEEDIHIGRHTKEQPRVMKDELLLPNNSVFQTTNRTPKVYREQQITIAIMPRGREI